MVISQASQGNNYIQLVDEAVDEEAGLAMVTEYAQPTSELVEMQITDPLLQSLTQQYSYVTRFLGRMSPEDMTLDPVFDFDGDRADISNVRDLTRADAEIFWSCPNLQPTPQSKLPVGTSVTVIIFVLGTGLFGLRRMNNEL